MAFSPDGQRLAAGVSNKVKIWDIATGKELFALKGIGGWGIVFSPDGQRLAALSGGGVKIWDSATGKELIALKGHAGWVGSVAFSPDGKRRLPGTRMVPSIYGRRPSLPIYRVGGQPFNGNTEPA